MAYYAFPCQLFLVGRTHDSFPGLKAVMTSINQAPCHGELVNFSAYTRAIKSCQGKIVRLYGA